MPEPYRTRLVDLAWKYREVFGPVKPGAIKTHHHVIDLKSERATHAPRYPTKPEDEEFVEKELEKLVTQGYIKEVNYSPYLAPIVVVPKKGPNGTKKKRLCRLPPVK